jgi:hypothetical protein
MILSILIEAEIALKTQLKSCCGSRQAQTEQQPVFC